MQFNWIVFKLIVASFVFLVSVVLMGNVQANQFESEKAFDAGIQAFKAKQYSKALTHFLNARDAGLSHSKLHYNLGVTYYKLQNYALAYQELLTATQDLNMASPAHLNAGFAAQRLEDLALARQHFHSALALAKTLKQQQLAQLAVNSQMSKPKAKIKKRWRASAQASYGYNDNVTFESEKLKKINATVTNDESNADSYYSVYAYGGLDLFKYTNLEISAYGLDYRKIDQYDYTKYNIRLNLFSYGNQSNIKLTGEYEFSTLGGDPYQQRMTAALLSRNRPWKNGYIDMRYYYTQIDVDNQDKYGYLNGNLQHFEAKLWQMFGAYKKLGIAVHIENNDRQDYNDKEGNLSYSFSPQRKILDVFAQYPIVKRLWLDLYVTYSESDYASVTQNISMQPDPNNPIVTLFEQRFTREDSRISANATLYARLNKNLLLNAGYFYFDNTSTEDFYTYTSNRYSMGLILQF